MSLCSSAWFSIRVPMASQSARLAPVESTYHRDLTPRYCLCSLCQSPIAAIQTARIRHERVSIDLFLECACDLSPSVVTSCRRRAGLNHSLVLHHSLVLNHGVDVVLTRPLYPSARNRGGDLVRSC
jgi:hypothetical protein